MSPNILYIICHDLGQQLSCYGDQSVTSPNLDRLAEEGVRFENYFCAATPCSPSRGCIMTGRYAHNNGLTGLVNAGWDMPERETTIVDYLNEAGYNTYQIGFQHERRDPLKNRYKHSESDIAGCEVVADRVAEFLRAAAVKEQPFYLNTGFSEVHLPFDRKEYVPDNPDDVYVPSYLPDNKYVRQELANFHGSIKFMDEAVGKIVRALNESQLGKNTVVIFTTDHGMAFPRAKSTLYDSGIKTALIMKFPEGMVKPGVYRELISNIGLAPTLLEMIGADIPERIQGKSFYRLLTGEKYERRDRIYSEKNFHSIYDPIRCIRTEQYKYIRSFEPGNKRKLPLCGDITRSIASRELIEGADELRPSEELYDIKADPDELNSFIDNPDYQKIRQTLSEELLKWMEDTDDPILKGPLPRPAGCLWPENPVDPWPSFPQT